MKTTIRTEVKKQLRRARLWARIIPASQIVKPYTGVTRHVGTAY
jgi:hypothetical protein